MAAAAGDAHPFPIYNARLRVVFPLLDADGDPISPSSPDSEVSQDQGTFADATNEATEIATSSGICYLDLIATELDTQCSAVRVQSTGAKTTVLVLYPRRLPVIRTGTAQAGAASTITLDANASAIDDFYNGCYVNITNDSPANALGQARKITDYVGSTKVATVQSVWGTNPSSASTFEILAPGETVNVVQWAGTSVDPHTAGYPVATIKDGTGTGEINTNAGAIALVDLVTTTTTATNVTTVNGLAANVITASSIATGAIDADAIAADAIGASEIADGAITAATFAAGAIDATAIADAAIDAATFAAGAITATVIATGAFDADALAADAVAEIADGVWDEDATGHQTGGTFGQAIGDPGADTTTIYQSVVTDAAGTNIAADIIAVEAQIDDIGVAGAGLTAIPWNAAWDAEVQSEVDDALVARFLDKLVSASGTADSGSTTTMVDAARTEANDYWLGSIIVFTSGALAGQARLITDFVAATDTMTFEPDLTQAVGTETYAIIPSGLYRSYLNAAIISSVSNQVSNLNDLSQTDIRTAVGLASANLDTQLDALPTAAENATAVLTTQMTESYRAAGVAPTLAQAQFETIEHLGDSVISGTTKTLRKLDGTTAKTYTLDSATTPTSITETT